LTPKTERSKNIFPDISICLQKNWILFPMYLSATPYFYEPLFGKLISPLPAILKYNFSIVAAIDGSFVFANYFHKKRRAFFEEILQRHFVCYELAKQKASRSKINGALRFAAIARKKKILVVVFQ